MKVDARNLRYSGRIEGHVEAVTGGTLVTLLDGHPATFATVRIALPACDMSDARAVSRAFRDAIVSAKWKSRARCKGRRIITRRITMKWALERYSIA